MRLDQDFALFRIRDFSMSISPTLTGVPVRRQTLHMMYRASTDKGVRQPDHYSLMTEVAGLLSRFRRYVYMQLSTPQPGLAGGTKGLQIRVQKALTFKIAPG